MKFRHITTWTSDNIQTGEVYETVWAASNYWLNKQTNENELLPTANDIFGSMQDILKAFGKSFDFSEISQEIQKSKYYAELLKEYIFEEIRTSDFPDKPSRKKCMFLVPYEVDIYEYASNLQYDLSTRTLLEIETIDGGQIHFADLTLLNCNAHKHSDKVEAAKKYWLGTNNFDLNTEVLFTGQFMVTSIIESHK